MRSIPACWVLGTDRGWAYCKCVNIKALKKSHLRTIVPKTNLWKADLWKVYFWLERKSTNAWGRGESFLQYIIGSEMYLERWGHRAKTRKTRKKAGLKDGIFWYFVNAFVVFPATHNSQRTMCKSRPCRTVAVMSFWVCLFELGRQARPGRQTGICLYRPVQAKGQNKAWGDRLTAKAITYQERHLNNK
jgi:hypothetical protein